MVFVEGICRGYTYEAIERAIAHHPEKKIRLFRQKGKGKGDAVCLGFQNASGDIFMILDADMTVPPEDPLGSMMPLSQVKGNSSTE